MRTREKCKAICRIHQTAVDTSQTLHCRRMYIKAAADDPTRTNVQTSVLQKGREFNRTLLMTIYLSPNDPSKRHASHLVNVKINRSTNLNRVSALNCLTNSRLEILCRLICSFICGRYFSNIYIFFLVSYIDILPNSLVPYINALIMSVIFFFLCL